MEAEPVNNKQVVKTKQWKKSTEVKKKLKKSTELYILITPVIIYFLIWHYWPMYGVIIAFKDYISPLGYWGSPWVGFEHFERFFNAFYFWRLIKNTIGISVYELLVGIPLPIILAIMFNEMRSRKLKTFVQSVVYAPHFISIVVVVSILLFFINPQNGVVNYVIEQFGGESRNFIGEPKLFWHLYVWSGLWQSIGWGTIIYTAAMSSVSPSLYEASYIDGASKLQRIWHVTIPGILPTIVILAILSFSGIVSVGFQKILLMQNAQNLASSEVISTFMYKSGLLQGQYSFAAAIGLFENIINLILLVVINRIARKVGETSLW